MLKALSILGFAVTVAFALPSAAYADTITYNTRLTFEAALGTSVTDNYSDPGYQHGDSSDTTTLDTFSNAAMSAVLGETDYEPTGYGTLQFNLIVHDSANDYYCAGCNGSFRLRFESTNVGTTSGVYGVGFDFFNQDPNAQYQAFVTFGDATTANYALPVALKPAHAFTAFFGLTSDRQISSIHFGLANGQPTFAGSFGIDNLTIGAQGAQSVPDSASSLTLLAAGLTALSVAQRKFRKAVAQC